jgi:hypothetical protein
MIKTFKNWLTSKKGCTMWQNNCLKLKNNWLKLNSNWLNWLKLSSNWLQLTKNCPCSNKRRHSLIKRKGKGKSRVNRNGKRNTSTMHKRRRGLWGGQLLWRQEKPHSCFLSRWNCINAPVKHSESQEASLLDLCRSWRSWSYWAAQSHLASAVQAAR